ncbi:MAG: hypothetical protein SWK76_09195 [Actinomycetota bacterium]|nr:hypothetical protein [Actinomycetota bacterium]
MKRYMTIIALLALVTITLSFVAGCGNDNKTEAKKIMEEADAIISQIEADMEELLANMSETFYNVSDMDSLTTAVDETKDATAELSDKADEAAAEYEKINDLEGVEDYQEYADLQIMSGDIFKDMLDTIDEFLDEMMEAVESGAVDEETMTEIAESFQAELTERGMLMDEAETAAEELKEDKNL